MKLTTKTQSDLHMNPDKLSTFVRKIIPVVVKEKR